MHAKKTVCDDEFATNQRVMDKYFCSAFLIKFARGLPTEQNQLLIYYFLKSTFVMGAKNQKLIKSFC